MARRGRVLSRPLRDERPITAAAPFGVTED